ncbi:actin cytoskeleton-regulatory complex protein PAN1-like [Penaeus japonicus]|uniref:actin cytoskeleton-regulatory complex protein PAN1-like n=1 Tax=Penaeus japonicus TaxID=27405 RepID=UPI001C70FF9A|nr:actin cytoskeleton-regulatory complex protein PAN1-like [Penaeus japonicus]
MNALTVISVAALVASGSATLLAYNGVYGGHHGLLGAYPYAGYSGLVPYAYTGALPAAAPLTLKTPVINTVAPAPVSYNVAPAPVSYSVAPAPVSYNVAPVAPVAPIQSQYHAQDEIGQYSFGYAGGPSSRAESRDAFGVVRGSYNYVDTRGKGPDSARWLDALGFSDTPEVVAAKLAHQQAFDQAAAAAEAAPDTRKKRSVLLALHYGLPSSAYAFSFTTLPPIPPSPPTTPPPSLPPTPPPLDPPSVMPSSSVELTLPPTPPPTACSTEYNPVIVI